MDADDDSSSSEGGTRNDQLLEGHDFWTEDPSIMDAGVDSSSSSTGLEWMIDPEMHCCLDDWWFCDFTHEQVGAELPPTTNEPHDEPSPAATEALMNSGQNDKKQTGEQEKQPTSAAAATTYQPTEKELASCKNDKSRNHLVGWYDNLNRFLTKLAGKPFEGQLPVHWEANQRTKMSSKENSPLNGRQRQILRRHGIEPEVRKKLRRWLYFLQVMKKCHEEGIDINKFPTKPAKSKHCGDALDEYRTPEMTPVGRTLSDFRKQFRGKGITKDGCPKDIAKLLVFELGLEVKGFDPSSLLQDDENAIGLNSNGKRCRSSGY